MGNSVLQKKARDELGDSDGLGDDQNRPPRLVHLCEFLHDCHQLGPQVLRVLVQNLSQQGEGFWAVVVEHQRVGVDRAVVQVVGIALRQRSDLVDGSLLLVHLDVEAALGQRRALALAVDELHAVEHVDGLGVVLLLHVEAIERLEQFLTALVGIVHALDDADGIAVASFLYVGLGQRLHVGHVVGLQFGRPLIVGQCAVGLLHLTVVLCAEEVGLRCVGAQLDASAEQVERGVVVRLLALEHGLMEEDVVVS